VRIVFLLIAIGFAVGGLVHLWALFQPTVLEPAPPWRHALFVLVNGAFAVGMVRRPRGFTIAFAALCAQQLVSHGIQGWAVWQRDHRIDWASLIVIIALPLALLALIHAAARPNEDDAACREHPRRERVVCCR
jgi:hypothetical protein